MNLIQSNNLKHHLKTFKFKNVSPAFVNESINIYADKGEVIVSNDKNQILMNGSYKF